jgi:hypothetical protein
LSTNDNGFFQSLDRDVHEKIPFSGKRRRKASKNSPLFEIARLLVPFHHVARCIINANHSIM